MRTSQTISLIAVYLLALWPQAWWFIQRTSDRSDEPLGILALVTVGCLTWSQRRDFAGNQTKGLILLIFTVVASFFLPTLITASLALLTVAFATGVIRSPGLTGLLVLSLPLMASLNFYFAWPVRLGIAISSEALLNLTGLSVTREGTLLLFQNAEVGVDAPCSGLRMLWFTGYLTCAMAALYQHSWKKFFLLIPLAIGLSIVANIIRTTLLFFPESGLIKLPYWTHEALGTTLHLLVALALFSFKPNHPQRQQTLRTC